MMGRPSSGLETLRISRASKYCPDCLFPFVVQSFPCGQSKSMSLWSRSPYRAGLFDGHVRSLKVKKLEDSTIAIAVAGKTTLDGKLYNSKNARNRISTAREHESIPVRHWDKHLSKESDSIWYQTLQKEQSTEFGSKSRWTFSSADPINLLQGTGLQSPTLKEMDNSGDFDISTRGIIFMAKNPELDPAKYFGSDLYYIPTTTSMRSDSSRPRMIEVAGFTGACESPVFSPNGESVAFVKTMEGASWYGHQHLFVVKDICNPSSSPVSVLNLFWPLSPHHLKWSDDSRELYVLAHDEGRCKLFKVRSSFERFDMMPEPLVVEGCVLDIHPFANSKNHCQILVNKSSFIDSSIYSVVDPSTTSEEILSTSIDSAYEFGIHKSQASEIWFKGGGDYNVHAFVIKPANFDNTNTYPVVFLLHGGPASAILDAWSTRWNPVLIAEQGYIVILPNFTGSTGYGPKFMEAIKGEFLGRPYEDVVQCFSYVKTHLAFADTDRAIAIGGSYGGVLINWIAGQPLGKRFKALVNHQGMLNLSALYGADVMDIAYDFGGEIWEVRENYDRYDPGRFTQNWTTPMLVIHSDLDFRCPVTEGLAAFTVLKSRGVEARFLNFEDEGHWVLKPENSLRWCKTVLGWINRFAEVKGGIELEEIPR